VLWHHYQYGQHQYFVQLGGDLAPRCFHPAYRVAFVVAFLPLLPLFALAGSVLNLGPWLRSHPAYVAWYPLMYALWAAKGFAVLESAVAPQRTLRLTPGEAAAVAMPRIWRALAALALVALGVVYFARALPLGLELTENGMILYPSWRVARGAVPYRDFVQLFGPSLYYANAAVFALAGPELLAVRWPCWCSRSSSSRWRTCARAASRRRHGRWRASSPSVSCGARRGGCSTRRTQTTSRWRCVSRACGCRWRCPRGWSCVARRRDCASVRRRRSSRPVACSR
jgi:hypothetical protein